jgi:hypothetical protein
MTWYAEALLAPHLGVTRNALEDFCKGSLKKNESKKIGRQNCISEPGLKKILAELGSADLDCSACALNADNGTAAIELTVTKIFPNVHLVQAANDEGERVLVRVLKNQNFRPRMKLKARPPAGPPPMPQLYTLEGRCPRYPGRW